MWDWVRFFRNMYNILFVSLVLRKRSGFWLISVLGLRRNNKNWLPGSLDYSLLCKKTGGGRSCLLL